jgi:hypothetical protein
MHVMERLKRGRERLDAILSSHEVGDIVFSEEELHRQGQIYVDNLARAALPFLEEAMAERGISFPPGEEREEVTAEELMEADTFLSVNTILEENGLIAKDGRGDYRLARKVPAGECRVKISTGGLLDFDEEELEPRGLSLCVHIVFDSQHEVVMEGTIIVEFSIEDIEQGLIGLDVDAESLDAFFSRFEAKRLAVMAVIEVVHGAGKISFDHLQEKLTEYVLQSGEVAEPVKVSLERGFLSAVLAEMRKLGYITGSQENIRLAR